MADGAGEFTALEVTTPLTRTPSLKTAPPVAGHFVPCPTCKQYSHSIGGDQLADAFMVFQSMFSHRNDGIPTQFCFDEKARDAAQVLMAAANARVEAADAISDAVEAELIRQSREASAMPYVGERYEGSMVLDGDFDIDALVNAVLIAINRASGMETRQGQDPTGLGAEHDSPTAESGDAQTPPYSQEGC